MEKTSSIEINQAYYGEVGKSHGCIQSTLQDSELKSFLTAFTDRPSSLVPGIALSPYLSGAAHGLHYIFSKTYPDISASRSGMVFTHTLIIQIGDLGTIGDLDALFLNFVAEIPAIRNNLKKLSFLSTLTPTKRPQKIPAYIQQTVERIAKANTPVLFCGEIQNFQATLSALWGGLPSEFRKKLSFTANFSTNALDNHKTIIYFQKGLQNMLKGNAYVNDEMNHIVEIASEVERYLLYPEEDNSFDFFLKDLEINLTGWDELNPTVKAYQLFSKIDHLEPDELRLLVRLISKVSPNPNQGKKVKEKISKKLTDYISSGKESNIKSLKNISVEAFDHGAVLVGAAISASVKKMFEDQLPFNVFHIIELFSFAATPNENNWWVNSVSNSLKGISASKNQTVVNNLWRILIHPQTTVMNILNFVPDKKEYEEILIKHFPSSINSKSAHAIASAIHSRNWWYLHAHLLLTFKSPSEAILDQMVLERKAKSKDLEGTTYILSTLEDGELLMLALKHEDSLFVEEYGKRTLSKEFLLAELDPKVPSWLKIWSVSLHHTNNLNYGVKNLSFVICEIMENLLQNISIPENILVLISKSEFADISRNKNRNALWKHIPNSCKQFFLTATAKGYVRDLINGQVISGELENDLSIAITNDQFMTAFLRDNSRNMNAATIVYEKVEGLKDSFLADYICYYSTNLDEIQSSRLGKMILSRELKQSAKQVFNKAKNNHTFRIALTNCEELISLNFIEKFRYGHLFGYKIDESEAYDELLHIVKRLYPTGPEDHEIWKRAGGDIARFTNHRSREENWRNAIHMLQHGGGGKDISINTLIKCMREDFENNSEIKELQDFFSNKK